MSIPPDFHVFIYRHLRSEEQRGHDMPTDWIFRGKKGNHLLRQTAYKKFYNFLGSGYGTHWMRKTFAGELFRYLLRENPADPMRALELCRKALGHARIDTTVKYLGIQDEKITSAQNSIFNIKRITHGN
jgi:site-specific recombinase XerD